MGWTMKLSVPPNVPKSLPPMSLRLTFSTYEIWLYFMRSNGMLYLYNPARIAFVNAFENMTYGGR